jgi:hypothetical protein
MKRCPACKRLETDDALAFCRADGTALITDSGPVGAEAGTVKFGSAPVASEVRTSVLPQQATDAVMSRPTTPTAELDAQRAVGTEEVAELRTVSSAEYLTSAIKRHKKGTVIALALVAIVATALSFGLYKRFGRKNAPFQSVKIVKLTNTGHVGAAAISPDGKYVAYTVREGDQQSIWILHVATRSNAQIVSRADGEVDRLRVS